MQDVGYGFPRTSLVGNWMNTGRGQPLWRVAPVVKELPVRLGLREGKTSIPKAKAVPLLIIAKLRPARFPKAHL